MKKNMKMMLASAVVIALAVFVPGNSFYAKSVTDLQKQQSNIKNNSAAAKEALVKTQREKSAVLKEVDDIDSQLDDASFELEVISTQLEYTQDVLLRTEQELYDAKIKKDLQYDDLKKRLRYMYENGTASYLEIVFKATDFTDFLNRVEYINRIAKYDKNVITKLSDTEELIRTKFTETEEQKREIEFLLESQTVKKGDLQNTLNQKEKLIEKLANDEQKYNEQIKDLQRSDKEIEAMIKKAQEEAARKAAEAAKSGSKAPAPTFNGRLGWPLSGHTNVSSDYGNRPSPINKKPEFHTGIDIPAPQGTNILAGEAGTVIFAGTKSGYGYTVIIDHGGGISTLYGHNSKLLVKVGDSVKRGGIIAKCGSTGYSTGPHCHYEVRVNGAVTNPWTYINK